MSKRWSYKVMEVKPAFTGLKSASIEEQLNQLGLQGWELVSVLHAGLGAWLYLKKEQ
ncbi:hypothetical protein CSC74_00260 [Pseudoxanthomonas yeongjuensis]|uniref:DUF4177 domain-containing protein n=1 Tax=Pseudoxanthomonas yeongjuensis TaxID=377616 RepID=UPI001391E650|nr:DUF4177 domain-containing protein [Pseudoxanthomonas yeongjuensis]KAF1717415.1 hypothetical protein CSC74_00260 [Pseudoxanthomonas yeongjuensis]